VEILLTAPDLATQISERQLQDLAALGQSSSDFLRELLVSLRTHPAQNGGQVIERYRDHPYAKFLERLASRELLICDRAALASQLMGTLDRLIAEELHRQRFETLMARPQHPTPVKS